MSSIASSSSSSSASDSSSDDDMSCDDNSSSSSQDSMTTNVRYVSEMNNNQKFENTFSTTNNSINSNIYDFNSNNESLISDNLLSTGLTHHKSTGSALSGGLLFSNSSLLSSDLSLSLNKSSKPKTDSSSAKTPRKRCKKFLLSYFFDWLITVLHFVSLEVIMLILHINQRFLLFDCYKCQAILLSGPFTMYKYL